MSRIRLHRFCLWVMAILVTGLYSYTHAFQIQTEYVVDQNGNGDYRSIQDAVDASKSFPPERITIYIKNGVYKEKVKVHAWNTRMSFIGESRDSTIISWDDDFNSIDRGRNSTFHTYTMLVEGNDFHAENLTVENTAGEVGQAVALHIDADRVSIENCNLIGNQDTVYLAGEGHRQFFRNCYIEGTTDFIFGGATAWFEDCQIHSLKNSYITAASTPENQAYGFVFNRCVFTADKGIDEVYLGRPWRNYARTVVMYSEMGSHIVSGGWHNWGNEKAEETAYYAEYKNSGVGFSPDERVEWSHQLTNGEAARYTIDQVFGDWNPLRSNQNKTGGQ